MDGFRVIHYLLKLPTAVNLGGMFLEINTQLITLFLKESTSRNVSDHKPRVVSLLLTALESCFFKKQLFTEAFLGIQH